MQARLVRSVSNLASEDNAGTIVAARMLQAELRCTAASMGRLVAMAALWI